MANIDSEFRAYGFIEKSLKNLGWDTRNPQKYSGGEVYTQNEVLHHPLLKQLLLGKKPENVVIVEEGQYWSLEAKKDHSEINLAVREAQDYAALINASSKVKCQLATGIAGTEDDSYLVETYFLDGNTWKRVSINSVAATGFLSKVQARTVLHAADAQIKDEVIDEEVFLATANEINEILHKGAINKKSRARVISSLLLAIVRDEYMPVSTDPTILIEDINSRVRALLREYDKENFAAEIAISLPTSKDNHIKNRRALIDSLQLLKNINIKSALNSGSDLLGQFYEIFLKYANDSKEIGIVLTPRHITQFAAHSLNITEDDYVYDPTCGTGGFLVSSFDKVKQESTSTLKDFKNSHVYGVDQDAEVIGLALVNMIFRGDGNSNIYEGNTFDNLFFEVDGKAQRLKKAQYTAMKEQGKTLKPFISKVLMNPPFAQTEKEYQFVDHALMQTKPGGLVFAVIPTSVMASQTKQEIVWRQELLKRHSLKAVIKLSEDLFLPNAHKGTYAVIVKAWEPHGGRKVLWALMDDGYELKKAKRLPSANIPSNMDVIGRELREFLVLGTEPAEIPNILSYSSIAEDDSIVDCSPEAYLPYQLENQLDVSRTSLSLANSLIRRRDVPGIKLTDISYELFAIDDVFSDIRRGDAVPTNQLDGGETPLISTRETDNGIEGYYFTDKATVFSDAITIPANGSTYQSFYHPYNFYALPDILVCKIRENFDTLELKIYLCSIINQSSWRYSYFRKCNEHKLRKDVKIPLPVKDGKIDLETINTNVHKTMGFELIQKLVLLKESAS